MTEALELQLFLAGAGPRASVLERRLRNVLEVELDVPFTLEIIDVLTEPERADAANITLTPALILAGQSPIRRLVGDVSRREQVLWLIGAGYRAPANFGWERRAETAVSETLADLCPDALLSVDALGRLMEANAAAIWLLGLEGKPLRGEVLGLPLVDGDIQKVTLQNGRSVEMRATATERYGQTAFSVVLRDLSRYPVGQAAGRIAGLRRENAALASAMEQAANTMTELRSVRDELERSNSELQTFAYSAAHDIMSPMRVIRHLAQSMITREAENLSEQGIAGSRRMIESINRIEKLVESLLAYAKAGAPNRRVIEVDLNRTVRWVLSDLGAEIDESGASCDVGPLPTVLGEPGELYQLFLNLISNAIKYNRPGVPPQVHIESLEPEAEGPVPNGARIRITDNGIGFEQKEASRIFRPFTRLVGSSEFKGSGIGLATVHKIVTQHDGRIDVVSSPGAGAQFTVTLPRASLSGA